MAVARGLRRLLRIRELEEEQSWLALESALAELRRWQNALAAGNERAQRGRNLVKASARSGELTDRLAGLEESRAGERSLAWAESGIGEAEQAVARMREEFLARRVERRQAETLIQEAEAREALEAARRSQQALDDWHRNRRHREESQVRSRERSARSGPAQDEPGGETLSAEALETREPAG